MKRTEKYNFELLNNVKVKLENPVDLFGPEIVQAMVNDITKMGLYRQGQCLNIAGLIATFNINDIQIELIEGWTYNNALNARYFHIYNYWNGHYFDMCSFIIDDYKRYEDEDMIYLTALRKWQWHDYRAAMISNKLKGCSFCTRVYEKYINDEGYLTTEPDVKHICLYEFNHDYVVYTSSGFPIMVDKGAKYQKLYDVRYLYDDDLSDGVDLDNIAMTVLPEDE